MDNLKLKQIASNFLDELNRSNLGEETSLSFIKNTTPELKSVKEGETFQAIVVGGTVFKSAVLTKINGELKINSLKTIIAPVFHTKNKFLEFVTEHLEKTTTTLALNFAFPLEPIFENNKLDGLLLFTTKEHNFEGLVGHRVGLAIEKYILSKTKRKISVSLANDTICLLLSGLTVGNYENLAAGIVGTGFNMAVFLSKNTTVNLESGGFNKFEQSEEGRIIDAKSENPGVHTFEKEMSGGYLYKHFNLLLKKNKMHYPPISETKELDALARDHSASVSELAKEVLEYSAQLFACMVVGIMEFKKQDLNFVMQGSLFWKGYNYKETVEETIKKLDSKYRAKFLDIENSDILGAAKLIA